MRTAQSAMPQGSLPAQPPAAQPPASQRQTATLDTIALPPKARGVLLGMTGTGKSTLEEKLIAQWIVTHKAKARVLILDSKPRFRAQWTYQGTPARRLYRKWEHGASLPDSVLLPLLHPSTTQAELNGVWQRGHHIAIAQGNGDITELDALQWAADRFFHSANAKYKQLVVVDELADYFGSSGAIRRGNAIMRCVRSGREKGVAVLGASQRPKGIPKALLTEMTSLYLFDLAFAEDVAHVREMGLPEDVRIPSAPHAFYFFSRANPTARGIYRLGGGVTTASESRQQEGGRGQRG